MRFETVRGSLLDHLRTRVRNGELTERGLARLAGISQPHMHNVLKGVRALAPHMSDAILGALHMSLLDLVELRDLMDNARQRILLEVPSVEVPLLESRVGPGFAWSERLSRFERFRVPAKQAAWMFHPAVARLGEDRGMRGVAAAGDLMLLDRAEAARANPDARSLHIVEWRGESLVRWVRAGKTRTYLAAAVNLDQPLRWETIALDRASLAEVVKARATPVAALWPVCEACGAERRVRDWERPAI
jgi:hypothetical protein